MSKIDLFQKKLSKLECDNAQRIAIAKAKGLTRAYILHPTKGWRKVNV